MLKNLIRAAVLFAGLFSASGAHALFDYSKPAEFDPTVTLCFDVFNSSDTAPATGVKKNYRRAPYTFTASSWYLTADQSGSAVVDVLKDTQANFPPTTADTIVSASTPSATSVLWSSGTTSAWGTTSIKQGDVLDVNIVSLSSWTRFQMCIVGRQE